MMNDILNEIIDEYELTFYGETERVAEARAALAALRTQNAALAELASFAQHHPNCPNKWSRSCDCGYWDAYKAAKPHIALLAQQEADGEK